MSIAKHLPRKQNEEPETSLVQGIVPTDLFEKVNKVRQNTLEVTWNELFEAMFKNLLEETGKKK